MVIVLVEVGDSSRCMSKATRKTKPMVKGIPWLPELTSASSLGVSVPQCLPFLPPFRGPFRTLFSGVHGIVVYGHIP